MSFIQKWVRGMVPQRKIGVLQPGGSEHGGCLMGVYSAFSAAGWLVMEARVVLVP